ncbi:NAD(P)-dependent oxidoreductase [Metaclostridioides mangenotii]|uniref:NADH-flavin reductase n=1 Tax=Metaclostridioides mangenotii TaxID=1540 RepID=A0ABS4EAF4_9FIRM|nr:NAD(P)H-binding protein [Clostridioides mangenotii]MBP1854928.1 putative NADH-flavin reductase [Clostridioides mangenotii]
MKIAVIGATGKQGSLLLEESIKRGHDTSAIVRKDNGNINNKAGLIVRDILDINYSDLKEFDVIVDALGFWTEETLPLHYTSLKHFADVLSGKENRLLVVGGAGSLYVDKELKTRLMDTPDFPDDYMPIAVNMGKAFDEIKTRNDVKWTYLSPAANFVADGVRTGSYKVGGDILTLNSKGESEISYADFAVAMIDEAENAKHIQERFSVVSK